MSKEQLLENIEQKRGELIQVAMQEGFCSPKALQHSMELDVLLNQYERKYVRFANSFSACATRPT